MISGNVFIAVQVKIIASDQLDTKVPVSDHIDCGQYDLEDQNRNSFLEVHDFKWRCFQVFIELGSDSSFESLSDYIGCWWKAAAILSLVPIFKEKM